jgi:hypothetical protein
MLYCDQGKTGSCTVGFRDLKTGGAYKVLSVFSDVKRIAVVKGVRSDGEGVAKVRIDVGVRNEFELRVAA